MGDIGSDTSSQLYMLRDAYEALEAKDPDHELLRLARMHEDGGGFDWTEDFHRRCVRDSDNLAVQGYARYTFALKDAARGVEHKLLDTDPPCDF